MKKLYQFFRKHPGYLVTMSILEISTIILIAIPGSFSIYRIIGIILLIVTLAIIFTITVFYTYIEGKASGTLETSRVLTALSTSQAEFTDTTTYTLRQTRDMLQELLIIQKSMEKADRVNQNMARDLTYLRMLFSENTALGRQTLFQQPTSDDFVTMNTRIQFLEESVHALSEKQHPSEASIVNISMHSTPPTIDEFTQTEHPYISMQSIKNGNPVISPIDDVLVYQQVAKEYSHAIASPISAVESAIYGIKDHMHEILDTSSTPSDQTKLLLSSLDIATLATESIKAILRNGAGFLPGEAERFSIQTVIQQAIRIVAPPYRKPPEFDIGSLPTVLYERNNLLLALMQLIKNAYEATDEEGYICIQGQYDLYTSTITLSITNDGPQIDEAIQDHLFDRGVSSKGADRGYGLASARRCLEKCNGQVTLRSSNTTYTIFEISFHPEEVFEYAGR